MKAGEASTADSSPDSTAGFIVKCRSLLLAAALGAATVAGFAPFDFYFVPWLTLAALIWLWRRAASPKTAAYTGFAFGGGLFGAGVSWVRAWFDLRGGILYTDGVGSGLVFSRQTTDVTGAAPAQLFPYALETNRIAYVRAFALFGRHVFAGLDVEENLSAFQLRALFQAGVSR